MTTAYTTAPTASTPTVTGSQLTRPTLNGSATAPITNRQPNVVT